MAEIDQRARERAAELVDELERGGWSVNDIRAIFARSVAVTDERERDALE